VHADKVDYWRVACGVRFADPSNISQEGVAMLRSRLVMMVAVVLGVGTLASDLQAEDNPPGDVMRVTFREIKNNTGKMLCWAWASENGFPKETSKAALGPRGSSIQNKQAVVEFDKVPAGTYAIGCVHDENNNGKMDTNFMGMPTEGYAASNDARAFAAPPKFSDAKFAYKGGPARFNLKVSY
jgi:uncharacterized protein (DUF2141 family)